MFNYCPHCGKTTVEQESMTNYNCANCAWRFWNNPKSTVAVVIMHAGQALFSKRAIEPNKDKYDFPGGFLEYGEDAYAAAVRELKEETGLAVRPEALKPITVYTLEYMPGTSVTDLIFLVTDPWQDAPFAASDDSAALEWKPLSFITSPQFAPQYSDLEVLLTKYVR